MRALASFVLALVLADFGRSEGLVLNFRDAEISAIVAAVARATGQRFIHDQELRGRVTIILEDEISPDEALEVLNAALLTSGYATIRGPEGSWKILPIEAAQGAAPWMHATDVADSVRVVTTLVRLEAADPDEIARVLGGRMRASIVLPYARTNGLIISATEDRLAEMLVIVRALDQASAVALRVFPLRYADAAVLAGQIGTALEVDRNAPDLAWKVVVDERTNSLVVQGAGTRVDEIARLIETLDVPSRSASGFHVVRVVNAEAETLANHLRGLDFGTDDANGQPGGGIEMVTDEATNSLVIRAAPAAFAEIASVIAELDRIPPRVGVEVHVWDVETTRALELGFDALIPIILPDDPNDSVAFATIGDAASLIAPEAARPFLARFTREPLLIPIVLPDGTPDTVVVPAGAGQLTAAEGEVTIRAITSPYLLATTGEEQQIFSGDQVPVPVSSNSATASVVPTDGTGTSTQNPFQTSTTIQRQDVGVDLRIKPTAVSDEIVALELHIEVSSVAESLDLQGETTNAGQNLGPTLRKFKVDANVRLSDGAIVLVAAAPADTLGTSESGVPYLKDIPILGWFFRSTRDDERRRRLVVAVQVNQIISPAEQRAETTVHRLAFERQLARTEPLHALTSAPYAVLVATRATRAEADGVAAELDGLAGTPAIVAWTDDDAERHDVYLIGFEEISELGPLSVELRARGFLTRFEVLGPPRT